MTALPWVAGAPLLLAETASTRLIAELRASFVGYARWFVRDASFETAHSYLWWLVAFSVAVMAAERVWPWRPRAFSWGVRGRGVAYAFMNFFGFGLLGYAAVSDTLGAHTLSWLRALGIDPERGAWLDAMPAACGVVLYLVIRDFIEYWIHRLLHRVPALWRVHQVHHSVTDMQVLAHLQYHPIETWVYRTIEFLPMWALGFTVRDFFIAHVIALGVGHLNHANVRVPMGPLRFVLNSAEMHILHHAKSIPVGARARGVNFGLTFSVWDFVFGTAYCPEDSARDTALGFEGVERYPVSLPAQMLAPFERTHASADGEVGAS